MGSYYEALLQPAEIFFSREELQKNHANGTYIRIQRMIKYNAIHLVGNLVHKDEAELLKTPNFSRRSLYVIRGMLAQHGLHLGMHLPDNWCILTQAALNDEFRRTMPSMLVLVPRALGRHPILEHISTIVGEIADHGVVADDVADHTRGTFEFAGLTFQWVIREREEKDGVVDRDKPTWPVTTSSDLFGTRKESGLGQGPSPLAKAMFETHILEVSFPDL
ncbi:MAG: DNA-directed polymerase subunit alpha [Candidatus Adlerbacteria bacterium]|nr:DNA-directed polymerase subunit alpha [Candidatus Adlerbacteria bacterium]